MAWTDTLYNELSQIAGPYFPSKVFESAEKFLNLALDAYVMEASRAMTLGIAAILATWLTIHFTVLGLSIIRGETQEPMGAIVKDIFRITLIFAIGTAAGAYNEVVIGGIRAVEALFVSGLSAGQASTVGAAVGKVFDPKMIIMEGEQYSAVGALWAAAMKHGYEGVIPDFGFVYAALVVAIGQGLVVLFCIIPFLMAKVYLALLMAIGPAAIFMLISPKTMKYFENWLSSTIAQTLTMALIVALATILSTIFVAFIKTALANVSIDFNGVDVGNALAVIGVALALVALNVTSFASQLSGGGAAPDGKGLIATVVQMAITRALFRGMVPSTPATPPGPGGSIAQGASPQPGGPSGSMGRDVGFAAGRGVATLLNNLKGNNR